MRQLNVRHVATDSTRQQAQHPAYSVQLDMQTQTAIQRQSAWHALWASTLQQGRLLALIVYLARTITIRTRQLRVQLALLGTTRERV